MDGALRAMQFVLVHVAKLRAELPTNVTRYLHTSYSYMECSRQYHTATCSLLQLTIISTCTMLAIM